MLIRNPAPASATDPQGSGGGERLLAGQRAPPEAGEHRAARLPGALSLRDVSVLVIQ